MSRDLSTLLHVAAAALGLSALLVSSATAYDTVRWLGARPGPGGGVGAGMVAALVRRRTSARVMAASPILAMLP